MAEFHYPPIQFQTHPSQYTHWKVEYDGDVAHVMMDVQIDHPMWKDQNDLSDLGYEGTYFACKLLRASDDWGT